MIGFKESLLMQKINCLLEVALVLKQLKKGPESFFSHHPAKFGVHRHCGRGDEMVLNDEMKVVTRSCKTT